jgi:hypothetical protein
MKGRREMGLKFNTSVASSDSFFRSGLIMANLNRVGTYPYNRD